MFQGLPRISYCTFGKRDASAGLYKKDYSLDINYIKIAFSAPRAAYLAQEHGNKMVQAYLEGDTLGLGDALITTEPNTVLCIKTADCIALLLADKGQSVVAAVHLGWRGAITNLLDKTIAAMRSFSAEQIVAYIAPCIRLNSYKVGEEFRAIFPADVLVRKGEALHLDLAAYMKQKLSLLGVREVEDCNIDTYTSNEYFSYRRATQEARDLPFRNLSCICLK